jgi:hypothetical protein
MSFSHHEQCPKCAELGKDRRGNNLARYTDGSAYCFSCHHKEVADKFRPIHASTTLGEPKQRVQRVPNDASAFRQDSNGPSYLWLKRFLDDSEIREHFTYSEKEERHIFRLGSYWEARSVTGAYPKVISHGDKPFVLFGSGDDIVVVEDVVSAIKVGRVSTALPLFGNNLPSDWMVRIHKLRPNRVLIWLDSNMVQQARKLAKKMNILLPSKTIETDLDPKYYSTEEIMEYLK